MTVELADYLIGLDKHIVLDGELKDTYLLDIQYPMKFRLDLASTEDLDQNLMVDIWESEKKAFKISLHHQDDNTQYGLLRVDYGHRHLNPQEILSSLPEKFHPYAGQWLECPHIHYVVDEYKPLVWAIPLEDDNFPVKSIEGREDYAQTLQAFFNKINVKTNVRFNHQMQMV
jgi:hypothetical protein